MSAERLQQCERASWLDTGAYASLGGPVLQRACTHAAGPYQIDNVDIEGRAFYTNNIPSGAFRGLLELHNLLRRGEQPESAGCQARNLPWEIRSATPLNPAACFQRQIADAGTALKETLLAVKDVIEAIPTRELPAHSKKLAKASAVPMSDGRN